MALSSGSRRMRAFEVLDRGVEVARGLGVRGELDVDRRRLADAGQPLHRADGVGVAAEGAVEGSEPREDVGSIGTRSQGAFQARGGGLGLAGLLLERRQSHLNRCLAGCQSRGLLRRQKRLRVLPEGRVALGESVVHGSVVWGRLQQPLQHRDRAGVVAAPLARERGDEGALGLGARGAATERSPAAECREEREGGRGRGARRKIGASLR